MQTIRKGSGRLPGVGTASQSGGGQEDCQEFVQADNQEGDRQTIRKRTGRLSGFGTGRQSGGEER